MSDKKRPEETETDHKEPEPMNPDHAIGYESEQETQDDDQ